MILLFHGFASAGGGAKAEVLKQAFPEQNILAPDLDVDPAVVASEIGDHLEDYLDDLNAKFRMFHASATPEELEEDLPGYQRKRVALVGTSFGGFYALYFSALPRLPALLINPVTRPSGHMRKYIGMNKNHKTGNSFEWKESYHGTLEKMETEIEKRKGMSDVQVVVGEYDDLIPPSTVQEYFVDWGVNVDMFPDEHRFLKSLPDVLARPGTKNLLSISP